MIKNILLFILSAAVFVLLFALLGDFQLSSRRVFSRAELFNQSSLLHDEELLWLKGQKERQEAALEALIELNEEAKTEVAESLQSVLLQRDELRARRAAVDANHTALREDIAKMEAVKAKIKRLEDQKVKLLAQEAKFGRDRAALETQRAAMAATKAKFKAELRAFASDEKTLNRRVLELQENQKNLQILQNDLKEEAKAAEAARDDEEEGAAGGSDGDGDGDGDDAAAAAAASPSTSTDDDNDDAIHSHINSTKLSEAMEMAKLRRRLAATRRALANAQLRLVAAAASPTSTGVSSSSLVVRHAFFDVSKLKDDDDDDGGGGDGDGDGGGDLLAATVAHAEAASQRALIDAWHQCQQKHFIMLASNHKCDTLWRRVLMSARVAKVNLVGQVVNDHGTLYLSLESGDFALFKPCYVERISASPMASAAESIAYHVDRLFGFYRTPAAIARTLSTPSLQRLLESSPSSSSHAARFANMTTEDECGGGRNGYLTGPMIGWPHTVELRRLTKTPLAVLAERFVGGALSSHMTMRLEIIRFIMFSFIFGDMKRLSDGRLFAFVNDATLAAVTDDGSGFLLNVNNEIATVDNTSNNYVLKPSTASSYCSRKDGDSAKVVRCNGFAALAANASTQNGAALATAVDVDDARAVREFTALIATACVFPHKIAHRLIEFNDSRRAFLPSTALLQRLYEGETIDLHLQFAWLQAFDRRVLWLRRRISDCVQRYGIDNVIFRELYPKKWF